MKYSKYPLYRFHRSFSKNQETLTDPNLTLVPLHPTESHAPGRGRTGISGPPQELHNGDAEPAAQAAPSSTSNQADNMDTDGEIDVDDCDDREYHSRRHIQFGIKMKRVRL